MVSVDPTPLTVYHTGRIISISPDILRTVPGVNFTVNVASVSPTTFGDESIVIDDVAIVPATKLAKTPVPVTVLVVVEQPV